MADSLGKMKFFEERQVRAAWDEEAEKWWFSVVDIVGILTDQPDYAKVRSYWKWLKNKLRDEGCEVVSITNQLKMMAPDGKMRLTDVADTEQVLRLIQSIPSKKAEPFKEWLAKVGRERIDETVDPEQSIDRAIQNYRRWDVEILMNKKLLVIATPLVLFFGCLLEPSISDITVHNASDDEVLDISLTYHHGTKGTQVAKIDILQPGETKTLSVVTQDKALQTMETSVAIEYYINGTKFDANNALADEFGNVCVYGGIGSGLNTKITIKNEGYVVQDIRKR